MKVKPKSGNDIYWKWKWNWFQWADVHVWPGTLSGRCSVVALLSHSFWGGHRRWTGSHLWPQSRKVLAPLSAVRLETKVVNEKRASSFSTFQHETRDVEFFTFFPLFIFIFIFLLFCCFSQNRGYLELELKSTLCELKKPIWYILISVHPTCSSVVQKKKTKVNHLAFNKYYPVILVGDDRGNALTLKLSPNLRKCLKVCLSFEVHLDPKYTEIRRGFPILKFSSTLCKCVNVFLSTETSQGLLIC